MDTKKGVSLCMIVKNEEKMLGGCLESVKNIVQEMIIVDTGSTDRTCESAKKYGAKVYEFPWEDDFAAARNFSISKAEYEWILLMDADERFHIGDEEAFGELVHTAEKDGFYFVIHSYTGRKAGSDYTVHYAFRLLRNNKKYQFKGRIHEQIVRIDGEEIEPYISSAEITLFHYGYLNEVIGKKNKNERNIPIIKKQLEEEPHNPFYLFNLGNEYMAANLHGEALKHYIHAYEYKDVNQSYCPHLMYRIILCLIEIEEYDKALPLIEEALGLYPKSTDIEYCRALIYIYTNAGILAVQSLQKCLKMGEPPVGLKFINGCGSFRPYLQLGEVYLKNGAYEKAIESFNQALEVNSKSVFVLYKIGEALNKLYSDKNKVVKVLSLYFADNSHIPNRIILTDILIREELYQEAAEIMQNTPECSEYQDDLDYMECRLLFFQKKYSEVWEKLVELNQKQREFIFLKEVKKEIKKMVFVIGMVMEGDKYETELLSHLKDTQFIFDLLETMLKLKEVELFDKTLRAFLPIYNQKDILIRLARLYYGQGYQDLAVKTIFESVQKLDYIDSWGAFVLCYRKLPFP